MTKIKIITHNGGFHADDVFAVATIKLWLEKTNPPGLFFKNEIEVIRTRNPEVIAKGDFVVDLGGGYQPTKKIFDHHQKGGAGERANGIPYSSFGLVWKEYGEILCDSPAGAEVLDRRLVQPIDAVDNGIDLCNLIYPDVSPYLISDLVGAYNFVNKNNKEKSLDDCFLRAVEWAGEVLEKEIGAIKKERKEWQLIEKIYQTTDDKRLIVLNQELSDRGEEILVDYPEPLFVVKPNTSNGNWKVKTVKKSVASFVSRRDLPESWAGKTGEELAKITGIAGAIFCHNKRFIVVANTKEEAVKLAELALETERSTS